MFWKRPIKLLLGDKNIALLHNMSAPLRVQWNRTVRNLTVCSTSHTNKLIKKIFSETDHHVFFGYYDLSPFSVDDNLLLAMHAPPCNVPPAPEAEISVGYYDLTKDRSFFWELGKTSTWCWQQGCRLQWVPGESGRQIIYNKLVKSKHGCVIQDIHTQEIIREFIRPIYAVSNDDNWGLSLNFSRLNRLRPGYGYANFTDETKGQKAPKEHGIWRINLKTGKEDFIFSIEDIANYDPLDSMTDAEHYFNHILFNPDGTRFMFFHIWLNKGKRFVRMITSDISGKNLCALANEGHVSHYVWKSDDELLAYSTHEASGRHYHLYKDKSDRKTVIGEGILEEDGHPSYSPDGFLLLTDTYHNRYRDQSLLIYDIRSGELNSLGAYYSPLDFKGEVRCDLHPRWSPSGRYICIDSPYKGKRAMYVLDVQDFLSEIKGF